MRNWFALVAFVSIAAAPTKTEPLWPGTEAFRSILGIMGIKPIEQIQDLHIRQDRKALIILGEVDWIVPEMSHGHLQAFLDNGGAVLIATDHDTSKFTSAALGVHVVGQLLNGRGPEVGFRRQIACPFLESTGQDDSSFRLSLNRVATNRPSYLRADNSDRQRKLFAVLPQKSGVETEHGLQVGISSPIEFGVVHVGALRYMVLADHSIFINTMMLQPSTECDNFRFAVKVLDWLTEGGKRREVLMFDNGTIRTRFDINPKSFDNRLPHPDVLMPALDHMIMGLERENAFNRAIGQLLPRDRLLRGLLVAASLLLAAFGLYFLTAGKLRLSPHAARLPDRIADLANGSSPNARRLSDLARGDLVAPARELAKSFLLEIGIDPNNTQNRPQVIAPTIIGRHRWSRRIARLWVIATSSNVPAVNARQLEQLARELESLRSAHRAGEFQVQMQEVPV